MRKKHPRTSSALKSSKPAVKDVRTTAWTTAPSPFASDPRLPKPGSTIERTWHDRDLKVKVLADHLEFEGRTYRSLSAIARELMGGKQVNGFLFFKLTAAPRTAAQPKDGKAAKKTAPKKPRAAKAAPAKGAAGPKDAATETALAAAKGA